MDAERSALRELGQAVYTPDAVANWPGRTIEWAPRQASVLVWDNSTGRAIAHAGCLVRDARCNNRDVKIGGIGGVMTHPEHRRKGYAAAAIEACLGFFRDRGDVDFALLVCDESLIPLYEHLGWTLFPGELVVLQRGERVPFTFNRPLTRTVRGACDPAGSIDLLGPPW